MRYFFSDVKGLNADIKRHMVEERRLMAKIESLSADPQHSPVILKFYRNMLALLLTSKAQITSKIGKKINH